MQKHLFLFTVGPVQSFIAQARKTQDLYAGSQILSDLIKVGILKIPNWKEQIIFPILDETDDYQSLPNRFIALVESSESDLKQLGETIETAIREALKKIAIASLGTRRKPIDFDEQINRHLDIHWAFHLVENNYQTSYKELESLLGSIKNIRSFEQLGNGLGEAGRKCSLDGENNALFFGKNTNKRFFNKKWNPYAIELAEGSVKIAPNEGLSAISFVKRFYKTRETNKGFGSTTEIALLNSLNKVDTKILEHFKDTFNKRKLIQLCEEEGAIKINGKVWEDFNEQFYYEENLIEKYIPCKAQLKIAKKRHQAVQKAFKNSKVKFDRYYAIFLFDGDKMGDQLSAAKQPAEHKDFSILLANFAKQARAIVNKHGQTVYAGGDDFLGFVNLHYLFEVMIQLRELFGEWFNKNIESGGDTQLTFSAGIVIAHYKTPLAEVLKMARQVEAKAKNEGNRNAFCMTVMKHSGEIQETVFNWGTNNENWKAIQYITKQLNAGVFSNKFITNLTITLYQLAGLELRNITKLPDAAFRVEFSRLLKRALIKPIQKEENEKKIRNMVEKLMLLFFESKSKKNIRNFIHALHIADFLSRKTN